MATRVNRKNAPTTSPNEVVTTEKVSTKKESVELVTKSSGAAKPIGKRLSPKPNKKIIKKPLGIRLKTKVQKLKLNPLAKAVLQNIPKKKLTTKNGIKDVKPKRRKIQIKKALEIKKEPDDTPPVLEPIFPFEENLLGKKQPRKRTKKITKNEVPELIDDTKIKQENDEDVSLSSDVTDSDIPTLQKQVKKSRGIKKTKIENETLEDVMNDLTYLIKSDDIKKEPDSLSESEKSDTTSKSKKVTKKQRMELLKKSIVKKENIENTLSKLDSADEKIIDMLDLNVNRLKKKSPVTNRRHSIEKCPIGSIESTDTLNVFSHKARSINPRIKRKRNPDNMMRSSPYGTRSDSVARMLRNGKQRKLKGLGLLDGLDLEIRKRRRLCSDSGSKLSGYESDSSFSDLASSHGTESNEAIKDDDKDIELAISTASNGPIDTLGIIDNYNAEVSLPEKSVLLDIMKQAFNNEVDLKKPSKFKVGTVVPSRFYGSRKNTGSPQGKTETILKEEIKEKIADEAPVMETELDISCAVQETNENLSETTEELVATDTPQTLVENNSLNPTPQIVEPTEVSEVMEPTVIPQIVEPTVLPQIVEPKVLPQIVEPTVLPQILEPTVLPQTVEPTVLTQTVEPTVLPQIVELTVVPQIVEPLVVPQIVEPLVVPQIVEPLVLPQIVEPVVVPQIVEPMSMPEIVEPVVVPQIIETIVMPKIVSYETVYPIEEVGIQKEEISVAMDCDDTKENVESTAEENELSVITETSTVEPDLHIEPILPATEEVNIDINTLQIENIINENGTEDVTHSESIVNEPEPIPMEDEPSLTENKNAVIDEDLNLNVDESDEKIAEKESILKALGLQRSRLAEEAKLKTKEKSMGDTYTGTLKTVIKINRDKKKGGRISTKTVQKSKTKSNTSTEDEQMVTEEPKDKGSKEKEATSPSWKHGTQSSDTAGAHRKSHYSNRSNMDGSSEHTSDGEAPPQDGAIKALVIPEKASSFFIHPGRLCKDECSYCFGKFGLFDTPCHIAQMKSVDRQNKILATEIHLTRDSCLCDACYRHVDRKSNTPSYMNKSLKRNSLVAPGPRQNHCHVLGCSQESSKILRRKWIIKMRKSICQVINLDLDNPGLHSIPICEEHYSALEHLMICAMCKRRLARNHIHYLGPETIDLNNALQVNGIPLTLNDKPVVCKLCKCFASIILKDHEERPETSNNFFLEYKRRLLHFNDIVPMDESAAEEPIAVPSKADRTDILKKKKKLMKNTANDDSQGAEDEHESPNKRDERVPSTDTSSQPQSRSESPSDEYNGVDYNTLIPTIAMEVGSDSEGKKDIKTPIIIKKLNDMQREGVEIVKVSKNDKSKSDLLMKKYNYGPSVSVRQLFLGEEDMPVSCNIDFNNVKEKTPEGWEKCFTTIQYDEETKRLWQELQKPYGNQSSFLRHLILLEKYFRNGDLVLSPRASHHSINYSESVHNRLRAYDNIPSSAGNIQPLSMIPFNKMHNKSSSGIITSGGHPQSLSNSISTQPPSTITTQSKPIGTTAISVTSIPKSTPITISQLNSPPLLPATSLLQPMRPKMGQPPGLISLHPGTTRPVAPLVKVPQPQKIKFPITKNWRPNLIPIDPSKKQERKTGLVQVISGGKPYHITLEDYKKMCAIKRSFEMKQKQLQDQTTKPILVTHNSVLKSIIPRKGLVISKTATKLEPFEGTPEGGNILEKLDKQVEKLESKLNERPSLLLPRIPRSLTVIPQTVSKKSDRPSSPVLLITPKSSSSSSTKS